MRNSRLFRPLSLLPVLLLSGCAFESRQIFISVLVLVPFLLVIGVLWLLHRRPGTDDEWEQERLPDCDDDDDSEDHFLM